MAILLTPLALADENSNTVTKNNKPLKSYQFFSNNSTVLSQVWGKNITTAEFMEKVYPGSLEVLPNDIVERIKTEPMVWPDSSNTQLGKKTVSASKSSESNNINSQITPQDIIGVGTYKVEDDSFITAKVQGQIDFASSSKVVYPTTSTTIPYISISSYLHKDNGASPIASTSTWGANTKYKIADSYTNLASGTHSYYTSGTHTVVWPVRCNPWETIDKTVSPVLHITR